MNPHWEDGISLDSVVDWMMTAGAPITRITDYAEWFKDFSAQLEKLDQQHRHYSALPLIHMWASQQSETGTKYVSWMPWGNMSLHSAVFVVTMRCTSCACMAATCVHESA